MSEHVVDLGTADREKRLVALSSVLGAVVLTAGKIIVGVATGSLGILSEAAHSGLDLVAALVTFWAVSVSSRPADREHTYGHGKIENISALFETLLLLATCVWIIYEAIERLLFRPVHVDPSFWAFATMAASIIIDFSRSRALGRVAKKYESQALEADALHFATDIWSSSVVIGGLLLVWVGDAIGVAWLGQADAVAALAVAGIVVWVSLRLGKKSIDELLDAVPAGMQEQARRAARVPGVLEVTQTRLRRSGPQVFVDLTLSVGRDAAFERAHEIGDTASAAVRAALPGADVVVHVEPVCTADENLLTTARLVAARLGQGAHAIRIYERDGAPAVELHLEVDETLTLRDAHACATRFEQELRHAVAALGAITTHIEPAGVHSATRHGEPQDVAAVRTTLADLRRQHGWQFAPHQLAVRRVDGELDISFHCTMDGAVSITEAHALTEQLEKALRQHFGNLGRVLIHVEPPAAHGPGVEE